ncbi:MAG TPA: rhodanese-like domain-containing protein [Candidatus Saccharimonadales bacterium]|nr:rhodanese-like domain-containing protein [Candidatus Saccharimonadales bacterium]
MTNSFKGKVELTLNIIIAIAVVVVAGITVKRYLVPETVRERNTQSQITVGGRMNVPNVNWEENKKTLIFFLKKDCPYCTSSAPFYRKLIEEALKRDVKLLAIFPHSVEEGQAYIKSLGLPIENVQSGSLTNYKIPGTPTVLLLDNTGTVRSVWIGGVSPEREQEVKDNFLPLFEEAFTRTNSGTYPPNESSGVKTTGAVEAIDAIELKKIVEGEGNVTIVDVDQREDYQKEHILNAKNIPSDEIFARANREIPKDSKVIFYCRCQGEGASMEARSEIIKKGFTEVYVLKGGLAAWKESGLPTVHSN